MPACDAGFAGNEVDIGVGETGDGDGVAYRFDGVDVTLVFRARLRSFVKHLNVDDRGLRRIERAVGRESVHRQRPALRIDAQQRFGAASGDRKSVV